jgi:hypothetical protein
MGHAFSFHVASEEYHGSRDLRTINVGLSLCGDEELAWWLVTWSSSMQVRATTHEKFKVLHFKVKIQGLALIGCALQFPCLRHCFVSEDFLQGENLRSMIG